MEKNLILVIDLDGTLISEEIVQKIYEESYYETLEMLRKMGVEVPKEFQKHNFKNYCAIAGSEEYRNFDEIYKSVFPSVLKKYIKIIKEKEGGKARNLYTKIISSYQPKDVFILTANPGGQVIVKEILPEFPKEKIIIIDGVQYVEEKKKMLERLKSLGEVLYIADKDEIDEKAAKKAGVNYVNISSVLFCLNLSERELYDIK